MPLQRRIPKRGFKNVNRTEYAVLNLAMIQHYVDKYKVKDIDLNFLQENSIVKKSEIVKVLANGELTSKVNVSAHAISASALEQIEKAGGTFTKL